MSDSIQLLLYASFFILFAFACIYLYFRYKYTYWTRKGVSHLKPKFPLGNNECIGTEAFSYGIETVEWYKEFKRRGLKCGGAWSWCNPVLIVTDPGYIKEILLKSFPSFSTRDFYHNPEYDPKNENIFVVDKEVWKNLRQKLTPVFTTAKMKLMFLAVVKCTEPMMDIFAKNAETEKDIDIREVFASYTTDVIGNVAFGLDFGSFSSEEGEFRKMGKEIFRSTPKRKLYLMLTRICEPIARYLGINNIPEPVTEFFTETLTETVKFRQINNSRKSDFLQLLINLYETTKDEEKPFTFDDLIGNVILFFIAGFDTSSTTMNFALYELALNPKLQDKTREEIRRVLDEHKGELTYESFKEMTYLRQVIDETLRKYPPVQAIARKTVKPHRFEDENFTLEKGISVVIPILALGRDPDYFPNPDQFDPERFNAENKQNINQYAYLPFGEGPRNCIAKRFGLMQTSIGLIQVLKDYKVSISPKTKMPLTLKKGLFLMQPNETLYLRITKA
ncbi:unnamed protein product [Ceutorhynchus assimilis]|uniref:Cytochrome P450 n=1 Tax=Ceutorhynchus assimilis TaxID=467358 RepID=A0A9N9MNA1_9CUCU|nr:unnamed protein product [Ceutorhynchus assimilis]